MNNLSDFNQIISGIKGQDIFDILQWDFNLFLMMKCIVDGLSAVTYSFYSEMDAINREMLVVSFPSNPTWERIFMFSNKWTNQENSSSAIVPFSQVPRT